LEETKDILVISELNFSSQCVWINTVALCSAELADPSDECFGLGFVPLLCLAVLQRDWCSDFGSLEVQLAVTFRGGVDHSCMFYATNLIFSSSSCKWKHSLQYGAPLPWFGGSNRTLVDGF